MEVGCNDRPKYVTNYMITLPWRFNKPSCVCRWLSVIRLKTDIHLNYVQNSVHASNRTQFVSNTKINQLILLREIIAILFEDRKKHINFVLNAVLHKYRFTLNVLTLT